MVSTLNSDEKYQRVRRNFCFYLDIQDHGLARSISRRIQDMGLQQEVFLTGRVTHVVRSRTAPCRRDGPRAEAMRGRTLQPTPHHTYVQLTVQKAISLLDKLYDTFFTASRKAHVRLFTKHFIKIEFLDKICRPVYKEFDDWPAISVDPDPPKERKATPETQTNNNTTTIHNDIPAQKMTRKSRPRIKEKDEREQKGGYCEMCNTDYVDAALHRRSPHHLAFVRDHTNFYALDSLIGSGADVTTFLDKATPINGERRSLRNMCNGDVDQPKNKRSKRSQSPDSTVNGNQSPRRNGVLDDEKKHNTRCSKRGADAQLDDRQYYKVVGVSTKLRSSGGFQAKRKDSPPACNGTKPLVVKFRKVRRSELSVLSDEAEQFMFPKRASSTSSTSSDDEEEAAANTTSEVVNTKRRSPAQPPPSVERRRLARPLALKEESSEEDSWSEDKRRRKRRGPAVVKRARRVPSRPPADGPAPPAPPAPPPDVANPPDLAPEPPVEPEVSPLREEPTERCLKWEDGRLKYTPAVEQLEFAFELVPHSEPWYETFRRQDQDKVLTRNVPQYFELYSKSPIKLPYEMAQLPPLKPNCCPLSDLVKREEKPASASARSYGTRGMKQQKVRRRAAALLALEAHPRKSPREHASTLAILGLLHRRKHDDAKSTASEDTLSDAKPEPQPSAAQEASERLRRFLEDVFDDAAEYDVSDEAMEGEPAVAAALPDVPSLVSECDDCDIIRNEIREAADRPRGRRGKFKKKNRTGWPSKRTKQKKNSRDTSTESEPLAALGRSSTEPPDTASEDDAATSESDQPDKTLAEHRSEAKASPARPGDSPAERDKGDEASAGSEKVQLDLKVLVEEGKEGARRRRAGELAALGAWLQPVVRVARVAAPPPRRLRSAARPKPAAGGS